jgi:signal transduction histidine kinase
MVYAATTQMNRFLLGEAEEPYEGEEDVFSQAVSMANSIGVKVDIKGNEPQAESARKILAQAVTECAANTVKHAEGDLVTVTILDEDEEVIIRIINNGKPPKGVIRESGGLLSLRRNVEAAGGAMKIEYEPDFVLELKLQESRE